MESFDIASLGKIAEGVFLEEGIPACRQVFTPPDTTLKGIPKIYMHKFIEALSSPLTEDEKKSGTYIPPDRSGVLMTGDFDEVQKAFLGELWECPQGGGPWAEMTDGPPVTPPTRQRIDKMLKGTSHPPDEVVNFGGRRGGKNKIITVEKVAINAVMAGCSPEMLPVVLAIAESGACVGYPGDSSFGHLYLVSGPYAKEIRMNSGFCYLIPGNPANTVLQRAGVLMGINLGGVRHGINNLERTGPLHWGTIFAENEDSPWEHLNEHFGYNPDESVLMFWGQKVQLVPFQNIEVKSAENLQHNHSGTPDHAVAALQTLTNTAGGLLAFTPDSAHYWAEEFGFENMQQIKDYMWDNVTRKRKDWVQNYWFWTRGGVQRFGSEGAGTAAPNMPPGGGLPVSGNSGGQPSGAPTGLRAVPKRGSRALNPDHFDLPDDADVPLFRSPEDITIIVAGGTGEAWTWGGSFGKPQIFSIDKWR